MKVHLVVAAGVHKGKTIPIPGGQLTIGRDPQCNLRPASPAISKKHCAIVIEDGSVTISDFGSTNGTEVNGQRIVEKYVLSHDDYIRVGPLEFTIHIEKRTNPSDGTPLPETLKKADTAQALSNTIKSPEVRKTQENAATSNAEDMDAAAMLLDDDDDHVPEGSTIMEIPSIFNPQTGELEIPQQKKEEPKKETSSNAAGDLLRKYLRGSRK